MVFNTSGWFTVRAVTNNTQNYQFAMSGPYYVERDGKPRVSRRSAEFFLEWIAAAEKRIRERKDVAEPLRTKRC